MSRLVRVAQGQSLAAVRHVAVVAPEAATGLVGEVYAQTVRDFGMVAAPLAVHSPSPGPLAASWLLLRETLVATGWAARSAKEAVASAVSQANACPYCVEVHAATLGALTGRAAAGAVAADRFADLPDPALRRVAAWARSSGERDTCQPPPVPAREVPELVGVALTFQYLNRVVHVFLGDSPLPPHVPGPLRRPGLRWLGRRLGVPGRYVPAGSALDLLPSAPPPADLSWASGRPVVAEALARAAVAIEAAGRRSVPPAVRDLVGAELAGWTGARPGIGRGWVESAVRGVVPQHRPAARLALLTAMSSYQVDDRAVVEFRGTSPGDAALVDLVSWASFAAARRAVSWLAGVAGTAIRP